MLGSRAGFESTTTDLDTNSYPTYDPPFDHIDPELWSDEDLRPFVRHTFAKGLSETPLKLEVNGRKGRRVVCVVFDDKIHYRIFDLDSPLPDASVKDGERLEEVFRNREGETFP